MDTTANLLLPYIMPSQAQKFVTHNEALQVLDALVMLSIKNRTQTTPPGTPGEGDRYIAAAGATGAWAGQDGNVACFQGGSWRFFVPHEGWLAWDAAEAALLCYSAGSWTASGASAGGLENVPQIGINTSADATSRLAVAADASLHTHAGSSHRLIINKHAPGDTASLVLQDNYAGRAEIGLAGDDDLSFKVSADGVSFIEALRFDMATGKPSFPQAAILQNYAVNLYQDSGRMAGNGVTSIVVGGFVFPDYLSLYNSATVASGDRFIHDNNDYGGASGTLDANVKALVDKIRDAADRRYGVEFFVAEITMGAGTADPVSVAGVPYYRCLYTAQRQRPPALTFHAYVRALDDDVAFVPQPGQVAIKDGVSTTTPVIIAPADGWVSLTVEDQCDPRTSYGYAPEAVVLRVKAAGNRILFACPALMGGITAVDDHVGVVAGANSWPA
jgi:hypothetical protein